MPNLMKIIAHSLVKNEERYIWYSIMSVINYVDKILVWDTGSTDKTPEIIELIKQKYPQKIEYKECGDVTPDQYTVLRQKMLNETNSDWFMILDGDEVWWEDSIKRVKGIIEKNGKDLDSLVSRYFNIVGDIYHYQPQSAGNYLIDGKKGHFNIRFINRNISGLYTAKPHGQHGYFDGKGISIQEKYHKKRIYIDSPYLHFTHMVRSSSLAKDSEVIKRDIKYKYELGRSFAKDFYYPEVFFNEKPEIVNSVWENMNKGYYFLSIFQTPLKKIKRRIFPPAKGY